MKGKKTNHIFVNGAIPSQKVSDDILKHADNTAIGAHSIFLGQVRADEKEGSVVAAIEYTAYETMAMEKMTEIREALFEKYSLNCLHVYHSLGTVSVGEICLFVFLSSRHRKAAMEACEELVEIIKKELPIWGKEIYHNQTSVWKENT